MKIDLHCHSKYSKRPSLWIMQKLGCPESFTEPLDLYQIQRERGMGAVTITDHNVIDGALEIAHLPDTFLGCEYTTYFPEDGCKVHVLAYGFTESQHEDMSRARENIYDLVRYFHEQGIQHSCAHPLFGPNDRLTVDHVEKLAILFKNWEINGDQSPDMNAAVLRIIELLTLQDIERLVNRHNILPPCAEPWLKHLTAGSDDHSSLNLGRTHTEIPGAVSLAGFWEGLEEGRSMVHCRAASPRTFARNVYGIAYQFYRGKLGLERHANKDILLRFLDRALQAKPEGSDAEPWLRRLNVLIARHRRSKSAPAASSLFGLARVEAEKLIREDAGLMAMVSAPPAHDENMDRTWFEFVNRVSDKLLVHLGEHVLDRLRSARLFDLFHSIGSTGALYALLSPYFGSFGHYARERAFSLEAVARFGGTTAEEDLTPPVRVAHFTDTFHEVNGVARTLQRQLASAQALGKDYTILSCFALARPPQPGVIAFDPITTFTLPEYPELQLPAPSFLGMLNRCYEERFTHIHVSTPGPVGLAGLGIARILGLPVSGTYHTALPQYGKILTDDAYVEEMLWKAMIWFYDALDAVYVPSRATADELVEHGLNPKKIVVYPRGVDTRRFHPGKRSAILAERFGARDGAANLLYVGRISKEKNLHLLAAAFKALIRRGIAARLIIAGDGPYREAMQAELADAPAVFAGVVEGEDLAALYASCDALVFPSATDTFGNVVLEAQASGIPVIVSDQGGPHENVRAGETGIIVRANDAAELEAAMSDLAANPARRAHLGMNARAHMEARGFDQAFSQLWDLYTGAAPSPAAPPRNPILSAIADDLRALAS